MELNISGPVLITGAGGGVGSHVAAQLLEGGRRDVLLHYRSRKEALLELVARYGLDTDKVLFQADLTDEEQVRSMHQRISESHGPLYGLVNLAGASTNGMSWKLSRADFESVFAANTMTTFLTCREFIPEMRDRQSGRIINISSVVAFTGVAGASHYCAAKAAIAGYSAALARELASRNIVVATIALGYIQYGLIESIPEAAREQIRAQIPTGRFGNDREVAGLIEYLLSDAGGYCNGQVYHLNGGLYR